MADRDGNKLNKGDIIEVVQMDDPAYKFLVGVRGVVEHIADEVAETQAIVTLQNDQVPGISTQQQWLLKVE